MAAAPSSALTSPPYPMTARARGALNGTAAVPGDKSISHRALILGALSLGETLITGLLEGEDVLATAGALRALGVPVERDGAGLWRVRGRGLGGFSEPAGALDFGNAGTGVRLMAGVLAGQPFRSIAVGDASLSSRPMGRIITPLEEMGAQIEAAPGGRLPLVIQGADPLLPIRYTVPVPSAQVKSAVLLAGLFAAGDTTVVEASATRDHTERMLTRAGVPLSVVETEAGIAITVTGGVVPQTSEIAVPADPSSAAFPLVAALIVPGSEVTLPGVMMNPGRIGLLETLREMGGEIVLENERDAGGEPVADLTARFSALKGVAVPPERAPSMIDEYPALAMAAAFAEGQTRMLGLGELRVKETDRLAAVAAGLKACGVRVEAGEDSLTVEGAGPADRAGGSPIRGGAAVACHYDHRIAMAFLTLGLASADPVTADDGAAIATSFPDFAALMHGLGAQIETVGGAHGEGGAARGRSGAAP